MYIERHNSALEEDRRRGEITVIKMLQNRKFSEEIDLVQHQNKSNLNTNSSSKLHKLDDVKKVA